MRALVAALLLGALLLPPPAAFAAEARVVDAAVASIGGALITLSDVTLARALGLFGLERSDGPITSAEIERYLDALLAVREAERLAVAVSAEDLDRAWEAAGGAALARRLDALGVDPDWARRLIESQLRLHRFVELRFGAFAFVTGAEVEAALGPGTHDDAARLRLRERLRDESAARALADWTADTRGRARVQRPAGSEGPWPAPFSLGAAATSPR